jgi:hypothetical protein
MDSLREDEMLGREDTSDAPPSRATLELASEASSRESRDCDWMGIATVLSPLPVILFLTPPQLKPPSQIEVARIPSMFSTGESAEIAHIVKRPKIVKKDEDIVVLRARNSKSQSRELSVDRGMLCVS